MNHKCEHKTGITVAEAGPIHIWRCEWGCDALLISVTDGQELTHSITVDEFLAMSERLTAAEALLAECQAQAAQLAQADSLTPADLRALARCAEFTAQQLNDPGDNTAGLVELARKVRQMADNATT